MGKIKTRDEIDNKYKWDLKKIYKSKEELNKDIISVKLLTEKLLKYKGKVLDSNTILLKSTTLYFDISRLIEKLYVYANLLFNEEMSVTSSQVLEGKIEKLYTEISTSLAFFVPEILSKDYSIVKDYIKQLDPLKQYSYFFEDMFRTKTHSLSKEEEKLLSLSGEALSASSSTFEMLSDTDLTFDDVYNDKGIKEEFNESKYTSFIKSPNRKVRKDAFISLFTTYKKYANTIAETLKGSIKKDTFITKARNYNSCLDMELSSDNIDYKLYDKLLDTISKNIDLSHEYISLKKEVLDLDELHMYDIYAPMVKKINKQYSYKEAIDLIIKALAPLGDTYIYDLKKIISSNCIDVFNNKGKRGGAYSSGTYDSLPYILTNFEGTFNDVSTLAHELGHSMHSYYSNTNNSYCNSNYTIFLAEIASTVNELLLNNYCYENATSKEEKLFFLSNLLDDMRATIFRQTMFAEFEKIIHEKDENKEILTNETLSDIYYNLNEKYYGKDIISDELIRYEWARIPHFYTSFYVYKYATGMSIASSIVQRIINNDDQMKKNYLTFLKSGGRTYSLDILKSIGIDIVNDDTIDKALDYFKKIMNEFRNIINS